MNFLPIILIIVFLLNKNKGGLVFLKDFDFESLAPILSLFGIDENTLKLLTSNEIKDILNGNLDIKSLMPIIINLVTTLSKPSVSEPTNFTATTTPQPEYLNPIKDVATAQILTTLGNYFEK